MSIYSILNTAKNALGAAQTCVQMTSNNIANVNTPGYARQVAQLQEAVPTPVTLGTLGNGVTVTSLKRYYDKYLESSLRAKTSELNHQSALAAYLDRIQQFINEDNSNLSGNITEYFNGWQSLSTDPTSTALKQVLVSQGQTLAQSINTIYTDLKGLQSEENSRIVEDVNSINGILSSIASLNQLILEGNGDGTNGYLDRKTALLNELASKMDVTTFDDAYGRTTVLTTGGKPLVEGGSAWSLTTISDSSDYSKVGWKDGKGNVTDITDDIRSGELKTFIDIRDTYAPEFISKLNDLAGALMDGVRWTVNSGGVSTTTAFFEGASAGSGDLAGNITVSAKLVKDPSLISSTSGPDNNPTDNDIALAMAALADAKRLNNGTSTFTEHVSSMASHAGQLTSNAETGAQYAASAVTTLTLQRESISGVSIDEEMTNLVKYQYAYAAAARLFTVADELLQSLLQVVR